MPRHDPLPQAPREDLRGAPPGRSGNHREGDSAPSDEDVSPAPDEGATEPEHSPSSQEHSPSSQEHSPSQDGSLSQDHSPSQELAVHQETPTPLQDRDATLPDLATPQDFPIPRPSAPSAPPSTWRRPLSPPLLASQALIEDVAPAPPLGQHARVLCVVAGVLFAFFGLLPLLGARLHQDPARVPSLVVGAVTLFAAVARVTYRKRAVAMVALGAIVAGLGIAGTGPAQGIAEGGALWSLARFVGATLLPAALLFRARYRAFEGARLVLGLAFLATLPYAFHAIGLVLHPAFGFAQLGAILALAALVAGLPGFMGSETTAAGSFVAPAMIAAFSLQAGFERLGALVPGALGDVFAVVETVTEDGEVLRSVPAVGLTGAAIRNASVTAVAFTASALLSALGLFQILAWKFAPAARKIDVRRPPAEIEERPSIEEWSTRN